MIQKPCENSQKVDNYLAIVLIYKMLYNKNVNEVILNFGDLNNFYKITIKKNLLKI